MRKHLRVLLTGAVLALTWSAVDAATPPALAATDRCPGMIPPLCRSVKACTGWNVCEAGPATIKRCCSTEETDYYYFPAQG